MRVKIITLIFAEIIFSTAFSQCISGNCTNGTGTYIITPEIIYTGSFNNSLPDGKGFFFNSSFKIYEGEVKNGLYHGKGTLYYANGSVYVGTFKNGLREGMGEYRTLKETFKGNFHLNALDGRFMLEDEENRNGIFSVYGQINQAYMGTDKVGVYQDFDFTIFDLHTGKLLEITPFENYNEPDRNTLYLDFGTRFYDTIKHRSTLPLELNSYTYCGKSNNAEPIFSQVTFFGVNIITINANNDIVKKTTIEPELYKIKTNFHIDRAVVNAVSTDLSKAVVNGILISIEGKKRISIPGVSYNTAMIFSPNADSLKVNTEKGWAIYSAGTGKNLSLVPLANLPGVSDEDFYHNFFPGNFYAVARSLSSKRAGMVFIENLLDTNNILPLINPNLTYNEADIVYQDNLIKNFSDEINSKEKRQQKYAAEMADRYGPDWRNGGGMRNSVYGNSTKPAEKERKCSFCRGSGVINIPGSGTSLEQDRTSGRWYKVVGSDNGQCPMCKGTGYLKL